MYVVKFDFCYVAENITFNIKFRMHLLHHNIVALLNMDSPTEVKMKNKDINIFVKAKKLGRLRAEGRHWGLRTEARQNKHPHLL